MATQHAQTSVDEEMDDLDRAIGEIEAEIESFDRECARAAKAATAASSGKESSNPAIPVAVKLAVDRTVNEYVNPTLKLVVDRFKELVLMLGEDSEAQAQEILILRAALNSHVTIASANADAMLLAGAIVAGEPVEHLLPIAKRVLAQAETAHAVAAAVAAQLGEGDDVGDEEASDEAPSPDEPEADTDATPSGAASTTSAPTTTEPDDAPAAPTKLLTIPRLKPVASSAAPSAAAAPATGSDSA